MQHRAATLLATLAAWVVVLATTPSPVTPLLAAPSQVAPAAPTSVPLTITVWYPFDNLAPSDALFLRGDFGGLSWDAGVHLTVVGKNQVSTTLNVGQARFSTVLSFKVLVNDQDWQTGANEQLVVDGLSASYAYAAYPWFGSQTGQYVYINDVYSPQLNNTRDLVLYLPPSYTENTLKWFGPDSVLVMHDGQNLFNDSTAPFGCWYVQNTLDPMIVEGLLREIIVVGVDNTDQRTYELTYSVDPQNGGGGGDLYLNFIEQTVMPLVLSEVRISGKPLPGHSSTRWGMAGSSLGGLITCYAVWTRPSVWGAFGACMSSSFWWNNQDFNSTILERHSTGTYPPVAAIYLDSGDSGPDNDDVTQTQLIRDRLLGLGFPYGNDTWSDTRVLGYYLDHGGQHNEQYWGARFHVPMSFGYQPLVLTAVPA